MKRTPEETRRILTEIGVYNEDGTLTDHYLPKKERRSKSKKKKAES